MGGPSRPRRPGWEQGWEFHEDPAFSSPDVKEEQSDTNSIPFPSAFQGAPLYPVGPHGPQHACAHTYACTHVCTHARVHRPVSCCCWEAEEACN